jgi:hypothetical protein
MNVSENVEIDVPKSHEPGLVHKKPTFQHRKTKKISQILTHTALHTLQKDKQTAANLRSYMPTDVTAPGTTREGLHYLWHSHFRQNRSFPQHCNPSENSTLALRAEDRHLPARLSPACFERTACSGCADLLIPAFCASKTVKSKGAHPEELAQNGHRQAPTTAPSASNPATTPVPADTPSGST